MRIAILNWSNRRFGGTGTYLDTVMPAFHDAGHEIALWHEGDAPTEHPVLHTPVRSPVWSVSDLGLDAAVGALRGWRPDVLYGHGLLEPAVERRALDVAPAVFFAHDYYGTCISGLKTFTSPVVTPCNRRFGWPCLAEYYPRRCGGLNPVTMVQLFTRQRGRLDVLPRYAAIVTSSDHMQQEYVKHGFPASRVFTVEYGSDLGRLAGGCDRATSPDEAWRLLFVGRMDSLKGGRELLLALPEVARQLMRPVHLTCAGHGPRRVAWEAVAADICRREPLVHVEFTGWVERDQVAGLYESSDLLIVPSLWPEPFALVGLEAARHHLPAVAFDVGGISTWLKSGINGFLAPGDPPTAQGLAEAVVKALRDPETHSRLRRGAGQLAEAFSVDRHLSLLMRVFDEVVH